VNAARALVKGAAHDPADGGFYRRTIDEAWKEPLLPEDAHRPGRIALALCDAAEAGQGRYAGAPPPSARSISLSRKLRYPDGTFAAALDGTLGGDRRSGETADFVRVGWASTGAQGLLIAALQRFGRERLPPSRCNWPPGCPRADRRRLRGPRRWLQVAQRIQKGRALFDPGQTNSFLTRHRKIHGHTRETPARHRPRRARHRRPPVA